MHTIVQAWLAYFVYLWSCPRTVEAAAADYERYHLSDGGRAWLLRCPVTELRAGVAFDFARIIGYRYGLLASVSGVASTSEEWEPGWNERLIRDGGGDAQRTAFRILGLVQAAAWRAGTEPTDGPLQSPA